MVGSPAVADLHRQFSVEAQITFFVIYNQFKDGKQNNYGVPLLCQTWRHILYNIPVVSLTGEKTKNLFTLIEDRIFFNTAFWFKEALSFR